MRWRCLNEVQPPKKLQAGHPIAWSPASSHLNEVQFPKELQRASPRPVRGQPHRLNEVQFPKELQHGRITVGAAVVAASMKCSSRRNCNARTSASAPRVTRLNEVQFPKELQLWGDEQSVTVFVASMKCSSRRNCNGCLAVVKYVPHGPQ